MTELQRRRGGVVMPRGGRGDLQGQYKRSQARIKADPEKYAKYLARHRELNKHRWARIRADPEKHAEHLARRRESGRKDRREVAARLTRGYVKAVLCRHSSILGYRDIPEALVQAKRAELQLRRVLKDGNSNNDSETADLGAGA
jgi:hypothetical protein